MSKNIVTLISGSEVTQSHWKSYHPMNWVCFSNFFLRCTVFEMLDL